MSSTVVRSKVIKIGNSRGIRIPGVLLEQVGLVDEVETTVQENKLSLNDFTLMYKILRKKDMYKTKPDR